MAMSSTVTMRATTEAHTLYGALSGVPDERIVPGWLNAAKGTRSYRAVIKIMDLIRQTEDLNAEAKAAGAYHNVGRHWPKEKRVMQRKVSRPHAELQGLLQRYVFRPQLTLVVTETWVLNLHSPLRRDDFAWNHPADASHGKDVHWNGRFAVAEGDVVLAVLRLAQRGLINRVRLCKKCSNAWIFARHRNYNFCTRTCREAYYTDDPGYLGKKAGHMRKYRERLRQAERSGANLRA
jgi:hypothetical protein